MRLACRRERVLGRRQMLRASRVIENWSKDAAEHNPLPPGSSMKIAAVVRAIFGQSSTFCACQ